MIILTGSSDDVAENESSLEIKAPSIAHLFPEVKIVRITSDQILSQAAQEYQIPCPSLDILEVLTMVHFAHCGNFFSYLAGVLCILFEDYGILSLTTDQLKPLLDKHMERANTIKTRKDFFNFLSQQRVFFDTPAFKTVIRALDEVHKNQLLHVKSSYIVHKILLAYFWYCDYVQLDSHVTALQQILGKNSNFNFKTLSMKLNSNMKSNERRFQKQKAVDQF